MYSPGYHRKHGHNNSIMKLVGTYRIYFYENKKCTNPTITWRRDYTHSSDSGVNCFSVAFTTGFPRPSSSWTPPPPPPPSWRVLIKPDFTFYSPENATTIQADSNNNYYRSPVTFRNLLYFIRVYLRAAAP